MMDAGHKPRTALTQFLAAGTHAGEDDFSETVNRILDAVRLHLNMDIAFVSRFIGGRREFTHIAAGIPIPAAPGDSEPLEDTFCQRVLDGRLPELIHDASAYPAAIELPLTAALPIGSHMNVPLRLKDGEIYGTICCLSKEPDFSLTARDLSTLRAFADLAADQIQQKLARERSRIESASRISNIISQDRLSVVYQPIHSLDHGKPVGVECLARFPDSSRPPNLWFDEAAENGLGVELETLAVRQALRGLPYIPKDLYLAVNVSPATVLAGGLEALLGALPPKRVVIELTEHTRILDYEALRKAMAPLRGRALLAVDDVGAGYSGLRHLLDLRPDIIKLDMSLTRDVDTDPARGVLAQAMVRFASEIGSAVVAEGVETEGEMKALRALGVTYAQGYHLSRPMPPVAAQQFLIGAGVVEDPDSMPKPCAQAQRSRARR